ncbi:MAG: hypothetical protein ACTSXW_07590 [Candidatus Baldrarchaeia archaeon]
MRKRREGLDRSMELPKIEFASIPVGEVGEGEILSAWDKVADEWSSRYSEYGNLDRMFVVDPVVLRVLGSVKGLFWMLVLVMVIFVGRWRRKVLKLLA